MLFPFLNPTFLPIILGVIYALWNTGDRMDGCCPTSNWEHRYTLSAPLIVRPTSLANITDAIDFARRYKKKVTLVGSGHSWSDIAQWSNSTAPEPPADGNDGAGSHLNANGTVLLCMRCYSGVVGVNKDRHLVTVLGGTTLKQLITILDENGLALDVFPSVNEQTIAGALATGTHGTGVGHGNLATVLHAMELVTADGTVRTVTAESDPDIFYGVGIGLGIMGVVTKVTLHAVPKFNLFEKKILITDDELYENFDTIVNGTEYVKMWKDENTRSALIFMSSRTTDEPWGNSWHAVSSFKIWIFEGILYAISVYESLIPAAMKLIVHYLDGLPSGERVSTWDDVFNIPHRLPVHPEMEFAVPYAKAAAALQHISKFIDEHNIAVDMYSEIRFVAADRFWLSNEYEMDTCHITLLMYNREEAFLSFHTDMSRELLSMGGRPHWGKMFDLTETQLRPLFPRWDNFVDLKLRLDPHGMFCNALVRRVFNESRVC